jgi:hypothetical protein
MVGSDDAFIVVHCPEIGCDMHYGVHPFYGGSEGIGLAQIANEGTGAQINQGLGFKAVAYKDVHFMSFGKKVGNKSAADFAGGAGD